jgi:hypothetical protein
LVGKLALRSAIQAAMSETLNYPSAWDRNRK